VCPCHYADREYVRFIQDVVSVVRQGDDVKRLAALCSSLGRRGTGDALKSWLSVGMPEAIEKHGLTPLMLCVKLKRRYCVQYLLEDVQVDPNVRNTKQRTTALILACFYGLSDVAKVILEHGGDPTLKNRYVEGRGMVRKGAWEQWIRMCPCAHVHRAWPRGTCVQQCIVGMDQPLCCPHGTEPSEFVWRWVRFGEDALKAARTAFQEDCVSMLVASSALAGRGTST
jgi:hypothetical protein